MTTRRRHVIRQAHPRHERPTTPYLVALGVAAIVVVVALLGFSALNGPGAAPSSTGAAGSLALGGSADGSPVGGLSPSPTAASDPTASPARPTATPRPSGSLLVGHGQVGRFGLGLLIADRGNGRLLIVDDAGTILWRFPGPGSLPPGQGFAADDAFLAPDGRTIVANDEAHQVVDRIDIVSRKVVWQYGHYNQVGSGPGYLHTPDDAYPMANGNVTVADIFNCRVIEISPAKKIVRQWGHTGVCRHRPPYTYDRPNGDTPLPDGGMVITEIGGSHVVRLDANGTVVFDIHVPVAYPSDAQLDGRGNVIVVDYASHGSIVRVSPTGKLLWRYTPVGVRGRLDHPSLAIALLDGTIAVNDDSRHRVVVIDPATNRIVWQYGHTDVARASAGYLDTPDGLELIPIGTVLH
jgi:outer membrane protein assembly factor BamB